MLESVITVDWDKEKITIAGNTITRLDLVSLAYYLAHDTHQQIADKMNRSKKSIEKTIGKITYAGVNSESSSKKFRRSLFVVHLEN